MLRRAADEVVAIAVVDGDRRGSDGAADRDVVIRVIRVVEEDVCKLLLKVVGFAPLLKF